MNTSRMDIDCDLIEFQSAIVVSLNGRMNDGRRF